MEEKKTIYVVTVDSQDQMKNDASNVINIEHDVLRVFRSKDDMKGYISRHYEKSQSKSCTIKTTENKRGYIKMEMTEYYDCPDNAHSFEGRLDGRENKIVIQGFPMELTETAEGIDLEDDLTEIYNG